MDKWVGITLADVGMWHCEWSTIAGEYGCCNCGSLVSLWICFSWTQEQSGFAAERSYQLKETSQNHVVSQAKGNPTAAVWTGQRRFVITPSTLCLPFPNTFSEWIHETNCWQLPVGKHDQENTFPPSQFFTFLLFVARNTFFFASPPVIMWKCDGSMAHAGSKERTKKTDTNDRLMFSSMAAYLAN